MQLSGSHARRPLRPASNLTALIMLSLQSLLVHKTVYDRTLMTQNTSRMCM